MFSTRRLALFAILPLVAVVAACGSDSGSADPSEAADLVLLNGTIATVDETQPSAQALAAKDGRIVAIGSDADVEGFIGEDTEVIDLEGRFAMPGFIEGHAHYMGVGQSKLQLDLMNVESWEEIVDMVATAVGDSEPGELITGRGWHQEKWNQRPERHVDGLPHHGSLSAVSPDNPVILTHASGHATFANAYAMNLSGITAQTEDPTGGEIVRDAQGEPIGAFRETASGLLRAARADAPDPDPYRVAMLAQEEAFSKGITSFHDAVTSFGTADLYRDLVDSGDLKIRLYTMIRADTASLRENLADARVVGYGGDRLTVRSIKASIDGALGPHVAWLLEPYNDLPSSAGLNTTSLEVTRRTAELAMEHDYQYNVHAIGDRGNREVLDLFEEAYEEAGGGDFRWRIEHAQHLHPDDISRFGEIGVIASMQGVHATSDGPWVEPKLGEERSRQGAYVWRKLWDTGAVVMNGTDAPVEDVDPIASYYSTVSRMMATGEKYYPEQALSRMEALESYTIKAAYGAFEEDIKGSLEVGKLADITVLSQDLLTVDEAAIPDTEVVYTIVGGEVVYRGEGR